jgi:hypothetical protein
MSALAPITGVMFGRGESVENQVEQHEAAAPEVAPVSDQVQEAPTGDSPIGRLRPSLASLMVEEGVATSEQLEQAAAEGQQTGERLGEVVLRHGWINEAGLAGLVARQWDLSFVALSMISVDDNARSLLSREVCARLGACPVHFDDGVPVLAVADPNEDRFTAVREALGTHCSFFVTTGSALAGLIDQQPSAGPEPGVSLVVDPPAVPEHDASDVDEASAEEAPPALSLAPVSTPAADPSVPVVDQLDQLLEQLLHQRESSREELADLERQLADHQRQLADLEQQRADLDRRQADLEQQQGRVRESVSALEAKLGDEEKRLESMRARLTAYAQSFSQH